VEQSGLDWVRIIRVYEGQVKTDVEMSEGAADLMQRCAHEGNGITPQVL
jgi:hypothetical protein